MDDLRKAVAEQIASDRIIDVVDRIQHFRQIEKKFGPKTIRAEINTEANTLSLVMSITDAKRIRAALAELDDTDLGNFGGILQSLLTKIPQQFG
jgi:hypothetical protein